MKQISGEAAIVTGAASGIGKATAQTQALSGQMHRMAMRLLVG